MKIGVLGFPSSGRKTLFFILTSRVCKDESVQHGLCYIPDTRIDEIMRFVGATKKTYPQYTVILTPAINDHDTKKSWIEPLRECDLLCIVLRMFESPEVYHPHGSVNPQRDRKALQDEIMLADLDTIEKRLNTIVKMESSGPLNSTMAMEKKTLEFCKSAIEAQAQPVLNQQETSAVAQLRLLMLKPILWIYNSAEPQEAPPDSNSVYIPCKLEAEVMSIADDAEREEYRRTLGLVPPGVEKLAYSARRALSLIEFYTFVHGEVRGWTIQKGTVAPVAAGKIHSDMERGFIKAEVLKYDDLKMVGSLKSAKELGKIQLKGKDYVIEDGDICTFRFNV